MFTNSDFSRGQKSFGTSIKVICNYYQESSHNHPHPDSL